MKCVGFKAMAKSKWTEKIEFRAQVYYDSVTEAVLRLSRLFGFVLIIRAKVLGALVMCVLSTCVQIFSIWV